MTDIKTEIATLRDQCQFKRPHDSGGLDRDWSPEILDCKRQNVRLKQQYNSPPRPECAVCIITSNLDILLTQLQSLEEIALRVWLGDRDKPSLIEAVSEAISRAFKNRKHQETPDPRPLLELARVLQHNQHEIAQARRPNLPVDYQHHEDPEETCPHPTCRLIQSAMALWRK